MGSFNRLIQMLSQPGIVRGSVCDDFHHFRVWVRHDGDKVLEAGSQTLRAPYDLCAAASARLNELQGMRISSDLVGSMQQIQQRQQCTHQFDLAALALVAADRGPGERRLDFRVTDAEDGVRSATLDRDGVRVLDWRLHGDLIVAPAPYEGRTVLAGFAEWAAGVLPDADAIEAAISLRRAVFLSTGRQHLGIMRSRQHAPARGGCWVQQPERNASAAASKDAIFDFSGEAIPAEADRAWLRADKG